MHKVKFRFYLFLIYFVFSSIVFAEDITITTYYPSPYGSYRELTSQRQKIGINYSSPAVPFVTDGLIVEGRVGIGTINPGAKLEVAGQIKITGGLPGDNKVLTSDIGGLASWRGVVLGGKSVMYLEAKGSHSGGYPEACPVGWTEADFKKQGEDTYTGAVWWTRSCYRTDSVCQVMYLEAMGSSSGGYPEVCPVEWTEADFKKQGEDGYTGAVWWKRTCYRCG